MCGILQKGKRNIKILLFFVLRCEKINIDNIDKLTELTICVRVDGDNDDSDNNQKILVGKTDVSLSVNTYIQDEEYLFVRTATNQSNTDTDAAISIIEDSESGVVLSMKNIGVIDNVYNFNIYIR